MNFAEQAAKTLILAKAGIPTPKGQLAETPQAAARAFDSIGPCVVKAQVPAGKRGKAGGVKIARTAAEAAEEARAMLGMSIAGHVVRQVLVEELVAVRRECYGAVLADARERAPVVLFSAAGGMDVETLADSQPDALRRRLVHPSRGFSVHDAHAMLTGLELGAWEAPVADFLFRLHEVFRRTDAELLEVNPLGLLENGQIVALDCKYVLDDAAAFRQPDLAAAAAEENRTEAERRAALAGLKFMELDGDVGVLANGAGLTMTTMDVIRQFGGRPADFLEIGGEAYTKAEAALGFILAKPGVKSLVVNFCGAFARTDVMAEGVVKALLALKPSIPVFFTIHGTGEERAVALVREALGITPSDLMEDAVRAAVEAARDHP